MSIRLNVDDLQVMSFTAAPDDDAVAADIPSRGGTCGGTCGVSACQLCAWTVPQCTSLEYAC
jgi:hypothetical protein